MEKKKRIKRSFTDEFKLKIIDECKNTSMYKVAKRHGIGHCTVRDWVKKHESIIDKSMGKQLNSVGSAKALSKDMTISQKETLLETVMMDKLILLMSTTKNPLHVIEGLRYMTERELAKGKTNERGDLKSFMDKLMEKTKDG